MGVICVYFENVPTATIFSDEAEAVLANSGPDLGDWWQGKRDLGFWQKLVVVVAATGVGVYGAVLLVLDIRIADGPGLLQVLLLAIAVANGGPTGSDDRVGEM